MQLLITPKMIVYIMGKKMKPKTTYKMGRKQLISQPVTTAFQRWTGNEIEHASMQTRSRKSA